MALPLPTDTVHVRIESRQYRLFKWDLGEGVPRRKLGVGAAIVGPYWILLTLIGVSPLSKHGGGALYVVPAALLVYLALRPDAGGRPHYALWADRLRFGWRRQFPMIGGTVSRLEPGQPFVVTASYVVVDPNSSRRLRRRRFPH